jgi:hypothetical protein
MSRYKIDPQGVQAVLEATKSEAAEFDTILKPLDGLVQDAVGAAFDLGVLAPALQAFFAEHAKGLSVIGIRVANGVAGAALATRAYNKADDDMAHSIRHYQNQATALGLADELARSTARHGGGSPRTGRR